MGDQTFEASLIENLISEHSEKLELEVEYEFELESEDFNLDQIVNSVVDWASNPIPLNPKPTNLTPPSIESFPSIELKALHKYLKYIYLGEKETLPVIIVSHLTVGKEESLMSVIRKHRDAISWTMIDINGLSPGIVQYCIHVNEEATQKRDPQH